MSDIELFVYAAAGFGISILSAIASGGGGFVMTPLGILFGLTPAESIATGKIGGLATTTGALAGMKNVKVDKKQSIILLFLALVAGLISSQIIIRLEGDWFKVLLGVALIIMAPLMYYKKIGQKKPTPESTPHPLIGYSMAFMALMLQGTFSSGMGTLVTLAIITGLGHDALQASVNKRISQLMLNGIIILSVAGTGLIVWKVAAAAFIGNSAGSYIGGKIAVKKGSVFVANMMAGLAGLSGFLLIVS